MDEALREKIDLLRQQYEELQESVALTDVAQELSNTATEIAGLPGQVDEIRSAGYAYANYLEHKVQTLSKQWEEVHERIATSLDEELEQTHEDVEAIEELWNRLELAQAQLEQDARPDEDFESVVKRVISPKREVDGLSAKFGAALGKKAEEKKDTAMSSLGARLGAAAGGTGVGSSAADIAKKFDFGGTEAKAESRESEDVDVLVNQLSGAMERLKTSLENSRERIRALYGKVPQNASQTQYQLAEIKGYLEIARQASFDWLAGEDMFMAVKAQWIKTGKKKEDPDGFFYVTNLRVVMEQKERVGKGFLGRGGEEVHQVLWESLMEAITEVTSEKKGMLGGIDLIHLKFGAGGPFGETTVEVQGGINAKFFANKLRQAVSGEIEKERGLERSDAELVEALADAPTECPVCGATFDQPVVRGIQQLECSYCGAIVRLQA